MNQTQEQRLHQIRERLQAATPGPWIADSAEGGPECGLIYSSTGEPVCLVYGNGYDEARQEEYGEYDIALIAHAPTDLQWLLEQVEARQLPPRRLAPAEAAYLAQVLDCLPESMADFLHEVLQPYEVPYPA